MEQEEKRDATFVPDYQEKKGTIDHERRSPRSPTHSESPIHRKRGRKVIGRKRIPPGREPIALAPAPPISHICDLPTAWNLGLPQWDEAARHSLTGPEGVGQQIERLEPLIHANLILTSAFQDEWNQQGVGQISCTGQDIYDGTEWTLDIQCKTKGQWDNAVWRQIQRGNLIAVRQARQPHGAPKTLEVNTDNCVPVRWERRSKTVVWARDYTLTDDLLFVEA